MTAREEILSAIRKNKPSLFPLPMVPSFDLQEYDLETLFSKTLIRIGGSFKVLSAVSELKGLIDEIYPLKEKVISNIDEYEGTHPLSLIKQPGELENTDLVVLQGGIAVAENASIWISDEAIAFRALPFICQHLVLVFSSSNLVYNMHQAYERIDISKRNYGVFIAGPSKTADIEQSLIIGAHGPKSMTAIMIK